MLGPHKKDIAIALAASVGFAFAAALAVEFVGRFAIAAITGAFVFVFLLVAALAFRWFEFRIEDARVLSEAAVALYQAIQPVMPLPPMSGFAIAPDSAVLLHMLLLRERPKTVVETGSGVSTLIIGYALKAQGHGRLISLEADPQEAQRTRGLVLLHGLADYVTVIGAPMVDVTVEGARYRWHDTRALDDVKSIDLVFDDSPPLHFGKGLRRAGMPVMRGKLGKAGTYLLNSVAGEERRAIADWLRQYPELEAETVRTRKVNVILRRRQHPSVSAGPSRTRDA